MDTNNEKIDTFQDLSFINAIKSLPEKLLTTIRFFERNDYWTVHGGDATFIATDIFKSTARIKIFKSGSTSLEYMVINKGNFEIVIKELLIIRQYKVEIYKLKNAKTQDWQLTYKASPGNIFQFEDILFNNNNDLQVTNCNIIAIRIQKENDIMTIGLGFCDSLTRQLKVVEFIDEGQFLHLEATLIQLRPRECLILACDLVNLKHIFERNNIALTECKKSDFDLKNLVQDLNRLLKPGSNQLETNSAIMAEMELKIATSGLSAIIKYLELLSDESNFGTYVLSSLLLGQFLVLNAAVNSALNLMPNNLNSKLCSLYSTLNRCRTSGGQRILANWILQPLVDKNLIEDRLDIVEALISNSELRQTLYEDKLRRIPDLLNLSRKLLTKKAKLQDCYKVYQVIKNLPSIGNLLEEGGEKVIDMFAGPIKELIGDFEKYVEMIETTLDLSQVDSLEFLVKSDFDDNLKDLKLTMDSLEVDFKKEFSKVSRDLNMESNKILKLESNVQMGYFFRVTRKEEKALRGSHNYDIIDTNKAGIRFRSVGLKKLNIDYMKAKQSYFEQQKTVVQGIIEVASGYAEPLLILSDVIGRLDVLLSFAIVATDAPTPYVRPIILPMGSGRIKLSQVRHACLERQNTVSFIPNDVNFNEEKNFFIITGPNMGGKSTFIRSVGLCVLMAQMGCFTPCNSAEISLINRIMTRVGANDCQVKGVSTFMAEMLDTSTILNTADKNSLIIIDELGRGTSTYDGFGLAWAIARKIAVDIGGFCLFATHFHELTNLVQEVKTIGNLQVTALISGDVLTLLYKVEDGVCDQSFGIHVAEMVQFPNRVIQNAKRKAAELEYMNQPDGHSSNGKLPKVTLEEAQKFIVNVKELETIFGNNPDKLWQELQNLKQSIIEINDFK